MALKVGDKVPRFVSTDLNGNIFDSANHIEKKIVVLYFYPKDNTAICTTQACSFRDSYQEFVDLGAEVIGVSADDAVSHGAFADKYNLPFNLLSDQDGTVKNVFGFQKSLFGLLPARITYVINRQGVITMIFNNLLGAQHIVRALEEVKKIQL